jgi:hypothetical protein
MWGILPIGSSFLAILLMWLLGEPLRVREGVTLPRRMPEGIFANANGVRS